MYTCSSITHSVNTNIVYFLRKRERERERESVCLSEYTRSMKTHLESHLR